MMEFTKVLLLVAFNAIVFSLVLVFVVGTGCVVYDLIKDQINKKGGEK